MNPIPHIEFSIEIWERENLCNGHYIGPSLRPWFPYNYNEYIPVDKRYSAYTTWKVALDMHNKQWGKDKADYIVTGFYSLDSTPISIYCTEEELEKEVGSFKKDGYRVGVQKLNA